MSVIINELEVVAAPSAPALPAAAPPAAAPAAPAAGPTPRDLQVVLRHHLERLDRVRPT